MYYQIRHEVPGRIRFALGGHIPEPDAIALEELFLGLECVTKTVAYPKAGCLAVFYEAASEAAVDRARPHAEEETDEDRAEHVVHEQDDKMANARTTIIAYVETLTVEDVKSWTPTDSLALAPRPRQLFMRLASLTVFHFLRRLLLPAPIHMLYRLWQAIPFWQAAWQSLRQGKLNVPVLDGAAIAIGFAQDSTSSGSTMYLLHVSDALEEFTQRRSESSLAQSLLDIPTTAHIERGGSEHEVDVADLKLGDIVIARLGDPIPVDGEVIEGTAAVNQSSLTGESMPVMRTIGDTVFAGTAIEEGEIRIRVAVDPNKSKIRSIVAMMEQTESMKSEKQKRIEHLADSLVPWNFLLAGIVALTTRDISKTAATLMVDYSCALRLTGSVAVMAAQRESAKHGFMVKGSRYFDAMAEADAIVFDKTGTLTNAIPKVVGIKGYNGYNRTQVLRLAACLEEHFPHPVARAVVNKANEMNVKHRELHDAVEYIVAHGIASSLNGKRVVIGSEHFVVEDEGIELTAEEIEDIRNHSTGMSPLFLAVDGKLVGVLDIDDPLKPDVASAIQDLRREGFKRIIMLTGDNHRAAARVATESGIDEFHADLLPEDKFALIHRLEDEGYKVCMVGDGVNDSPALSAAHVSIAMSGGSAVAREAADISLVSNDLGAIVKLRRLSRILRKRMDRGYGFTVAFNSLLLALGITGILTPELSSAFHNGSTIAVSALNTRKYLND